MPRLPALAAALALAWVGTTDAAAQPRHRPQPQPAPQAAAPALSEEEFAAIPLAPGTDWFALADALPALVFDVDVSVFGRQATLAIHTTRDGDRVLLGSTARTRGLLRLFYRVQIEGTSRILGATGAVEGHAFAGSLGRRDVEVSRVFDYTAGEVRSEEVLPEPRTRAFALEDGCQADLLAGLLAATRLPTEPGARWRLPVFHDDRIHTLLVTAEGTERIAGPDGEVEALRLAATMPVRPSSFFRRGGRMTLWVGTDARRLPLRLRLETTRGSATAELREAPAPAAETLAQPAAAAPTRQP